MRVQNIVQNATSKIIPAYRHSTGSVIELFDNNFRHITIEGEPGIEKDICRFCINSAQCREMQLNAMREAARSGNAQIYRCELGLHFWVCPVYSEGKCIGALRGSGFLDDKAGAFSLTGKCNKLCNGIISPEQFTQRVVSFPFGSEEKIQSLAEMLLLCAELLSAGSTNYHKVRRLRTEQKASLSAHIDELKNKHPQGSIPPGYSLDKERQLITFLRRGNNREAGKILDEVLASLAFSNPNQFKHIQFRALELAVLLARAGAPYGSIVSQANAASIRQIQEAKTVEDIASILHSMVGEIAGEISMFQGIPHASAMRKAEKFIRENLARKMSLGEIARVAGLSAPYFSTIFKVEMGENLSRYINRLRVEKASKMLLETNLSLCEIAGECCFEDQSWFSKIFKSFTGVSPGKYRNQGGNLMTWSLLPEKDEDYTRNVYVA